MTLLCHWIYVYNNGMPKDMLSPIVLGSKRFGMVTNETNSHITLHHCFQNASHIRHMTNAPYQMHIWIGGDSISDFEWTVSTNTFVLNWWGSLGIEAYFASMYFDSHLDMHHLIKKDYIFLFMQILSLWYIVYFYRLTVRNLMVCVTLVFICFLFGFSFLFGFFFFLFK